MKYVLYRSVGSLNRQIEKHELVAVEFGQTIEDVSDKLRQSVYEDISKLPEYAGCVFNVVLPEKIKEAGKYQYLMTGVIEPPFASQNMILEYGVMELSGYSNTDYSIGKNDIECAILRISEMEQLYDEVTDALCNAKEKLKSLPVQRKIHTLSNYLSSGDWLHDLDLDTTDRLPRELKRGVLSQDGLYDLLCEISEVEGQQEQ